MNALRSDIMTPANLRYWEDGAYFQSWYPVCLATDLQEGVILGRDFLDTRIVLYRDRGGEPIVQTAFCPHLGADLSLGELVGGELRCAYHHWRFAANGRCSSIPGMEKAPGAARVLNYPVAESWGLIWVFNGAEPLCEVPTLPGVTEEDVIFKTTARHGIQPVDSWIPTSNSVDFQHLLSVHHFPETAFPKHIEVTRMSLSYDINLFHPEGRGIVTGQNTFSLRYLLPLPFEHFTMFSSNAVSPGHVQAFFVAAVRKPSDLALMPQAEEQLEAVARFADNLYVEDERLLNTIRFRRRGDAKLVKLDVPLGKFLDYIDALPRARPLDA
jgi:phenylpropionate dioxygenase-like ring-hydroxylating dioxygenase large terminal subunit